jgi:hypothetical protein
MKEEPVRANIERGKLIPPKSLLSALQRQKQLVYETKRIGDQINDPYRADSFADKAEYAAWRGSAERALKILKTEMRLLTEWIEIRQQDSETLLREAYEVLKVLEVETEFATHETALMERLDDYFDGKESSEKATG